MRMYVFMYVCTNFSVYIFLYAIMYVLYVCMYGEKHMYLCMYVF